MSPEDLARLYGPDISPDIAREVDGWREEMDRFERGEMSPEKWRLFRLGYGIYGQRQPGVHMVRVKIPGGGLTGSQLVGLADLATAFSNGNAHLTTRQDVQFYFVKQANLPALLRGLADARLTTREACGNAVRNVTACPVAGHLAEEAFDVRPYTAAAYSFLVRNPFCQQLARKFKISFSACPEDCAAAAIQDIGALGRVVEIGGRTRYGFRLLVGGGLGPTPFLAKTLDDFVPIEDLLVTLKAILKVFADLGNRRNRARARLKFVVNRLGIDAFRRQVLEARAALDDEEREEAQLLHHVPDEFTALVEGHLAGRPSLDDIDSRAGFAAHRPAVWASEWGASDPDGFLRWQSCSVRPHVDPDRVVVTVLVPLGDLTAAQLRSLGRLARAYSDDEARLARDQNVVFASVRRGDLRGLYRDLVDLGLAEHGAGTALDVTSCPGADTCRLGITSSKGLARAIRDELHPAGRNGGLGILRDVTIKMSGCPNSCGQHHVANIGFHGVAKTQDGKQVPAYQVHLGGRTELGKAAIGKALGKVHARNIPKVVAAYLDLYKHERESYESFADFAGRLSDERARQVLDPFLHEVPAEDERFVDWGKSETFSTDDLGNTAAPAGAAPDRDPFEGYGAERLQTEAFLERGLWGDALANLNRGQYSLARILLDALGKKPDCDYEVTCELRAHVIDRGFASELWNEIHDDIAKALRTKHPEPVLVRAIHARAGELLNEARTTLPALVRRRESAGAADYPG